MPSVRRRPRPNQTFTWAPGVATRGGSIRRRGVRAPPERRKHKSSRRCSRAPSPRFSAHISRHFQQAQKEFTSFYCEASCQSPIPTQKLTRTAQTRIWDFNKKIIIKRRNTICCLRGIFHRCTPPLCPVLSCIGGRRPQTFSGSTRDLWSSVRSLGLFVPPLSETLPSPNWSAHPAVRRVGWPTLLPYEGEHWWECECSIVCEQFLVWGPPEVLSVYVPTIKDGRRHTCTNLTGWGL